MEHSFQPVGTPWRTATLVASTIAALELAVLLVIGFTFLAEPLAHRFGAAAEARSLAPVAKPKPTPAVAAGAVAVETPRLTREQTSVMVLNGNGLPGAAASTAERTRALGYTIGNVGNAPRSDFTRSLVMYRAGYRPEAERLAEDLKLKIVAPLDGLTPAELLGAHVAVVVGG